MTKSHFQFTESSSKIEARVNAKLVQMTLEEKVGQMVQVHLAKDPERLELIRQGLVGSVLNVPDVKTANELQRIAVEESRLGIPLIIGNDVIHGFRTIFPIPLAESCAWDLGLVEAAARTAAEEAAANGTNWIFAPMVDICRDPRWGRIAEGAGEDPFLGQEMARARVRGFQARKLPGGRRITACPKHFAAYGAVESGKDYNTVDISERSLRDVYLPPFRAAFEAGAGTTMTAFNDLNGIPASANAFLLRKVLRQEWGFPGMVVSDFNAIAELLPHGLAPDLRSAAQLSALAGVDMDMASGAYLRHLAELVRERQVSMDLIDESVRRVLRLKFQLSLFEQPYVEEEAAESALLKPEARALALEAALKSMVLLKNEGNLLPLNRENRVALIGPLADRQEDLLGCWSMNGNPEDVETVFDGFLSVLGSGERVSIAQGCPIEGGTQEGFEAALEAARAADAAVLVVGEAAWMSGEAHSRAHLGLPGRQQALVEAVYATGTPTVVVLMSGRPLVIPWIAEHIPAVLAAWHGGIRAGRAVAELIYGMSNPSGKLTASWPRTEGQIPVYYAHKNTGRPVGGTGTIQFDRTHFSNYLDESNAPLYPFGHGLSYTRFEYEDLVVETPRVAAGETLVLSLQVRNAGARAGDEVVQCYVRDLVASVTRPVKELKAFQRISLQPGERKALRFEIPASRLGFHGSHAEYLIEPGDFRVWVGPDSSGGLEAEFELVE